MPTNHALCSTELCWRFPTEFFEHAIELRQRLKSRGERDLTDPQSAVMSMGFAVPASIGVAMATPSLRPYVLVGDGAFQMTGSEVSTAVRLGLNPIIIVLNNDGYGTMRKIREGCFNVITQWNYSKICELVGGGEGITASTNAEFDDALSHAQKSDRVHVIELRISRGDTSPQLSRIAAEVRKMRGKQTGGDAGIKTRAPAPSV